MNRSILPASATGPPLLRCHWLLCLLLSLAVHPALADDVLADDAGGLDWWAIDRSVAREALQRDVGQWARACEAEPAPSELRALAIRFNVFLRAGHDRSLRATMDQLGRLPPAELQAHSHLISQMGDALIGRELWDLSWHHLRQLPQAHCGWGYVVVRRLAHADERQQEEVERLLRQRQARDEYWLGLRLAFEVERQRSAALLDELAADVRRQPDRLRVAQNYLLAARTELRGGDLMWLARETKIPTAFELDQLGRELAPWPPAAVHALQRSLNTKFQAADQEMMEALRRRSAALLPLAAAADAVTWERELRDRTKAELMRAYQRAGQSELAQPLLEELSARYPDGIPQGQLARQAGQIQSSSGARVIEGRIRAAAPQRQQDSAYWLQRAEYYLGRRETEQADASYRKAIETAESDHERWSATRSCARFLQNAYGPAQRLDLLMEQLREQLQRTGWSGPLTDQYVQELGGDLYSRDERLFWQLLEDREKWEHRIERLLFDVAQREAAAQREEASWERVEPLAAAAAADGTRAKVLGWVMTRCGANRRAIPLLREAARKLADQPDLAGSLHWNLYEALLAEGEWRQAEPELELATILTTTERHEHLGALAVVAAERGAPRDSLRIWDRRTRLERGSLKHIDPMRRANMGEALADFYRAQLEADPGSEGLARALHAVLAP